MSVIEQLVLNGVALNDDSTYTMEALDIPPPPKRLEWVSGSDSDGALLARDPLCDNRTITARLRVFQQTTADAARAFIGAIVDQLEECERWQDVGLPLVWTPADAAVTPITFRCLAGEITDLPVDWQDSGWFVRAPIFTIRLTCLPFGEGAQVGWVNLITNPGFEANTTDWGTSNSYRNATGATLTRVTAQHDTGVAAAQVVTTAVATQGIDYPLLPVVAGQPVTVSMRLKGNAGGESVRLILGDSTVGAISSSNLTLTTSWQTLSVTLTPTLSGLSGVSVVQNVASVKTWFVDSVIAVQDDVAATYFDGSTGAGYAWFGTASNSMSAGPYAVNSNIPLPTLEITSVPGDVSALGQLVVADAASQSRRYVAWGMESRWYPTSSPPSLIIDSTAMVTGTGYAASTTSPVSGAYSGASSNALAATLNPVNQVMCGLGDLTHVGDYRVHLRLFESGTATTTTWLRLAYKVGDGPWRNLPWKQPATLGFGDIDMGLVSIPPATLGGQRWTGRIEAYSTGSDVLTIDVAWLMPAERYGKARAPFVHGPPAVAGFDAFTSRSAAATLGTTSATLGGTWTTSGATTDFAAADAPAATDETMTRATVSDSGYRFARLGSTDYTNIETSIDWYVTATNGSAVHNAVGARWVDSSNYVMFEYAGGIVTLKSVVAGSNAAIVAGVAVASTLTWYTLRLIVYSTGTAIGTLLTQSGAEIRTLTLNHSSMATGGAVATGRPFFADENTAAVAITRYYDGYYHGVPAAEPIVINSGRYIQFRDDATLRQDAAGTYAGGPPEFTGARFGLPPAGSVGRKARIAVLARRNDLETSQDDTLVSNATTDSTTLAVIVRPRYYAIPR